MKNIIFYKLRKYNDKWAVAFLNENSKEITYIDNDLAKLRAFIKSNKDCILVGGNNFEKDDIILASLLKYGNVISEITPKDINNYLPITLDITQGIVRNSFVSFNNMICSIWEGNDKAFPNYYGFTDEEIKKELISQVEVLNHFYQVEERNKFLNWKADMVKKYRLPKYAYRLGYEELMGKVLGVGRRDKRIKKTFVLDPRLSEAIKAKNDDFLNKMLKRFEDDDYEDTMVKLGNCVVSFDSQGILGTVREDIIDNTGANTYLYIDFNSFGPNILINNGWLKGAVAHPNRYSQIKDLRIDLKAKGETEQLYYKSLLNAGLNVLGDLYTKEKDNVGKSLSISGILVMLLLYTNLKEYGIDVIECNTDGFIVKCPNNMVDKIKEEVRKIEEELSLSCDVDVVKKLIHFDTANYVMEFENGKVKHLGSFGLFQENELYCSGIPAIDCAMREFYLNGVPVEETIERFKNEGNLRAFQIVKKYKKGDKARYLLVNGEYVICPCKVNRLFAVKEENLKNSFYVLNAKGEFELDTSMKGTSKKDGYYYFEVSDMQLPDINDLDLSYYIDYCQKIINKHGENKDICELKKAVEESYKDINLNLNQTAKIFFIDLDGTLILNKTKGMAKNVFIEAAYNIIPEEDMEEAFYMLQGSKSCLLYKFFDLCKNNKGYGNVENFARFLLENGLFKKVKDINVYREFVKKFIEADIEASTRLSLYSGVREFLEWVKGQDATAILYSNWFRAVQESKLKSNGIFDYFDDLYTIDNAYAKGKLIGWRDALASANVSKDDRCTVIGNGGADIVPVSLGVPSIILDHEERVLPNTVLQKGVVVNSFDEIMDERFMPAVYNALSLKKTKK